MYLLMIALQSNIYVRGYEIYILPDNKQSEGEPFILSIYIVRSWIKMSEVNKSIT